MEDSYPKPSPLSNTGANAVFPLTDVPKYIPPRLHLSASKILFRGVPCSMHLPKLFSSYPPLGPKCRLQALVLVVSTSSTSSNCQPIANLKHADTPDVTPRRPRRLRLA
jgi:hypothetical protein